MKKILIYNIIYGIIFISIGSSIVFASISWPTTPDWETVGGSIWTMVNTITIDSWNVWIGKTPTVKLDVNGNVSATNIAWTLTTATQTNITSVWNLSTVTVTWDAIFDTTTLFVDSANNRVWIGTLTPWIDLDVNDSDTSHIRAIISWQTNNPSIYMLADEANNKWWLYSTAPKLELGANNSIHMTILDSGNVGIGTTSPTEKLEVKWSWGSLMVDVDGNDPLIRAAHGNTLNLAAHNQAAQVTITWDGNVGIGTTSPSLSSTNGTTLQIWDRFVIQDVTWSEAMVGINMYYDNTGWKFAQNAPTVAARFSWWDFRIHAWAWWVAWTTNSTWDNTDIRFVVKNDGNVGIGTTNPTTDLNIYDSTGAGIYLDGSSSTRVAVVSGGDGGNSYVWTLSNNDFAIDTNSQVRMFFSKSGNVGIGTTIPSPSSTNGTTLQIWDRFVIQDVTWSEAMVGINMYYDNTGWKFAQNAPTVAARFSWWDFRIHAWAWWVAWTTNSTWDNTDIRFVVKNNGNVGIGTLAPAHKLHVSGNTYITGKVGIGVSPESYNYKTTIFGNTFLHGLTLDSPTLVVDGFLQMGWAWYPSTTPTSQYSGFFWYTPGGCLIFRFDTWDKTIACR